MNWSNISSILRRKVKVGDKVFKISSIYTSPLLRFASSTGSYELNMDDIYSTALRVREGVFVDIGANIGQTFVKVLGIDSDREYVGFEPQLQGCFLIYDFIAKNELMGKHILPIGLSDRAGIVRLGVSGHNDVAASFVDEYRPDGFYSSFKYISVMKGDQVFESLDPEKIAVIKIDVEGAELEVIRGLRGTIAKYRPYLLFEVLPHFLARTKKELDEKTKAVRDERHTNIQIELRELGYLLFQIQPKGGIKEVTSIKADPRRKFDYLGVPSPDPSRLIENLES